VEHQHVEPEQLAAPQLVGERLDRLFPRCFIVGGEVDQIARVDRAGLQQPRLLSIGAKARGVLGRDRLGGPHPV